MNNSGKTLNERLVEAELIDDFGNAVKKRDSEKIVDILLKVNIEQSEAEQTAKTILENPSNYGF